jgi:predicted nucleotidyltransferase
VATESPDFVESLKTLVRHGVEFIIVGGVSAVLQGAPLTTFDLDLVHLRTPENLNLLQRALEDLDAYYRESAQRRLRPKPADLSSSGHHLLMTRAGPLDLLGTIGADRDYQDLLDYTHELEVEGLRLRVLNLETLIEVKEQAGFEKDRAVLPILRSTLEEKLKKKNS